MIKSEKLLNLQKVRAIPRSTQLTCVLMCSLKKLNGGERNVAWERGGKC